MGLRSHSRIHRTDYQAPDPWAKILRAAKEGRTSLKLKARDLQILAKEASREQTQVEAIRERVTDDYRTIPQPDHGVMLTDLKVLLAEVARSRANTPSQQKEEPM